MTARPLENLVNQVTNKSLSLKHAVKVYNKTENVKQDIFQIMCENSKVITSVLVKIINYTTTFSQHCRIWYLSKIVPVKTAMSVKVHIVHSVSLEFIHRTLKYK